MSKIDYKKEYKELYNPSAKEVSFVDVPKFNYLMVDGKGDPKTSKEFKEAIETLYPVAYSIKFDIKKNESKDFGVMPLEGLWWAENVRDFDPESGNRNNWQWTLMIMQPELVSEKHFQRALEAVEKKNLPAITKIRFESLDEGTSTQIMHIGPFSEEGDNIKKIHQAIWDKKGSENGEHHEIYLSDMRKVAPSKMKTVLRQPYR